MKSICGGFEFDSDFDSGNLARVECDSACGGADAGDTASAFRAWTTPDCSGTEYEATSRTWFHFSVAGGSPGNTIQITIWDLQKQNKLFAQGHQPVVKINPGGGRKVINWHRGCKSVEHDIDDDGVFYIRFTFEFASCVGKDAKVFFAFCYPWSYEECQSQLESFDALYLEQRTLTKNTEQISSGASIPVDEDSAKSKYLDESRTGSACSDQAASEIYYHRELLIKSLDNLRVDLLTISSMTGIGDDSDREERYGFLFPDTLTPRARRFNDKKVYFLSSRVHPGETPASHVFNGFLKFLLSRDDPRAQTLRNLYVFKLIPILNPDGVKRGHYRQDARGVNLNRFYDRPSLELHPSIYASREVCLYHHRRGRLEFYLDLHAHAARRGCFIFGNALEGKRQTDNVTYARLVALNSAHFDFGNCCFSERNMFSRDKRDGMSKEGSGRVGIFLATNLTHVYTLECNYNSGREVNLLPAASGDDGRAEKVQHLSAPPPYTDAIFEDVGRACALAVLDLCDRNPWSRLPASEFESVGGLKRHISQTIRSSRSKRGVDPSAMPRRVAVALRNAQALQVCRSVGAAAAAEKKDKPQRGTVTSALARRAPWGGGLAPTPKSRTATSASKQSAISTPKRRTATSVMDRPLTGSTRSISTKPKQNSRRCDSTSSGAHQRAEARQSPHAPASVLVESRPASETYHQSDSSTTAGTTGAATATSLFVSSSSHEIPRDGINKCDSRGSNKSKTVPSASPIAATKLHGVPSENPIPQSSEHKVGTLGTCNPHHSASKPHLDNLQSHQFEATSIPSVVSSPRDPRSSHRSSRMQDTAVGATKRVLSPAPGRKAPAQRLSGKTGASAGRLVPSTRELLYQSANPAPLVRARGAAQPTSTFNERVAFRLSTTVSSIPAGGAVGRSGELNFQPLSGLTRGTQQPVRLSVRTRTSVQKASARGPTLETCAASETFPMQASHSGTGHRPRSASRIPRPNGTANQDGESNRNVSEGSQMH